MRSKTFSLLNLALAIFSITFITFTATAQSVNTKSDSSIIYKYNSETDSILHQKIQRKRIDSINTYTISTKYNWSVELEDWIGDFQDSAILDQQGRRILSQRHRWNQSLSKWEGSNRSEYLYDSVGNMVCGTYYHWSESSNGWYGDKRYSYAFDSLGRTTNTITYNWDTNQTVWKLVSKLENVYNQQNDLTSIEEFSWDVISGDWASTRRTRHEFSYNIEGYKDSSIQYRWEAHNQDWEKESKKIYSFDSIGQIIMLVIYSWNGLDWAESGLFEYDYDSVGHIILEKSFNRPYGSLNWVGEKKSEYIYDTLGINTHIIRSNWNYDTWEWFTYLRLETYFNKPGEKSSSYIYQRFNTGNQEWLALRRDYSYNAIGEYSLTENYLYDTIAEAFNISRREFFYYGAYDICEHQSICNGDSIQWRGSTYSSTGFYSDTLISVLGQDSIQSLNLVVSYPPESFAILGETLAYVGSQLIYTAPENPAVNYHWMVENGKIVSGRNSDTLKVFWDNEGDGHILAYAVTEAGCLSDTARLEVYLEISGTENLQSPEINIYPVPVRDILHISSDIEHTELEILDLKGRTVIIPGSNNHEVDLSHLADGIYILRFKSPEGNLIGTKKILKSN